MSSFTDNYGSVATSGPFDLGTSLTPHRLLVWSGSPPTAALAGAGVDVDGVSGQSVTTTDVASGQHVTVNPSTGYLAHPGLPVQVEAGAPFSAGATLQSDSSGRAIAQSTGKGVLRALEAAAGAGSVVWAVWTSGR